jgi:hypothetical protein
MATPRRTPRSPWSAASPSTRTPGAPLHVPLCAETRIAAAEQLSWRDGSPASRRSRHAVRSGNRRPIESAAPIETGTSPRTACLGRRPVGTRSPRVPRSPSARRVFARSGTPPRPCAALTSCDCARSTSACETARASAPTPTRSQGRLPFSTNFPRRYHDGRLGQGDYRASGGCQASQRVEHVPRGCARRNGDVRQPR